MKFLILWDHPSGKSALAELDKDMKAGVLKQFGLLSGTTRGYAVVEVKSEFDLVNLRDKYLEYGVIFRTVEPVAFLEDFIEFRKTTPAPPEKYCPALGARLGPLYQLGHVILEVFVVGPG